MTTETIRLRRAQNKYFRETGKIYTEQFIKALNDGLNKFQRNANKAAFLEATFQWLDQKKIRDQKIQKAKKNKGYKKIRFLIEEEIRTFPAPFKREYFAYDNYNRDDFKPTHKSFKESLEYFHSQLSKTEKSTCLQIIEQAKTQASLDILPEEDQNKLIKFIDDYAIKKDGIYKNIISLRVKYDASLMEIHKEASVIIKNIKQCQNDTEAFKFSIKAFLKRETLATSTK